MPYGSHGEKRYIKVQKSFSVNTSTLIQMNCSYVGMMNVRTRSKLISWSSKCLGSTNTDDVNRNCSMEVKIMNGIFAFICLRPMKQEV